MGAIEAAIWDCGNKYEGRTPEWSEGAKWAADEERGSCRGPGRCYYGAALTWTYKDLKQGQSIWCGNGHFGCDPLPLFKKFCYFTPEARYTCAAQSFDFGAAGMGHIPDLVGYEQDIKAKLKNYFANDPFPAI